MNNWSGTLDRLGNAMTHVDVADEQRPPPNAPPMTDRMRADLAMRLTQLEQALSRIRHAAGIPRIRTGADVGFDTVWREVADAAFAGAEWCRIRPVPSTVPSGGGGALADAKDGFQRALAALAKIPPA